MLEKINIGFLRDVSGNITFGLSKRDTLLCLISLNNYIEQRHCLLE